jgi:hypothetical protein
MTRAKMHPRGPIFSFWGKGEAGRGDEIFFFEFGVSKCSAYGSFVFPQSA